MRCADNHGNGDCDSGAVGYRLWNRATYVAD